MLKLDVPEISEEALQEQAKLRKKVTELVADMQERLDTLLMRALCRKLKTTPSAIKLNPKAYADRCRIVRQKGADLNHVFVDGDLIAVYSEPRISTEEVSFDFKDLTLNKEP